MHGQRSGAAPPSPLGQPPSTHAPAGAAKARTLLRLRDELLADGVDLSQLSGVHHACTQQHTGACTACGPRAGQRVQRSRRTCTHTSAAVPAGRQASSASGAAAARLDIPAVPGSSCPPLPNHCQPHPPTHSAPPRPPLLEKSKRRRSGSTMEPFWLTWSPSTCGQWRCHAGAASGGGLRQAGGARAQRVGAEGTKGWLGMPRTHSRPVAHSPALLVTADGRHTPSHSAARGTLRSARLSTSVTPTTAQRTLRSA